MSLSTVNTFAHSGRTDSSGGHRDNRNRSGLGYYHYHHGYGPHLHPNGVCPYEQPIAQEPVKSEPEPSVIAVDSISISSYSKTMDVGEVETLSATISPYNATDQSIAWSSSDPNVATVSSSGDVTAINPGSTSITATASNGKTHSIKVNVPKKDETVSDPSSPKALEANSIKTNTPKEEKDPTVFELAIVGVCIYFGVKYFRKNKK